jgi:tetratricopeptide (TPR) repeat protein
MNRFRPEVVISLFLLITTLAVYWPVRNHDFVNFDDDVYVTENSIVQKGWTVEGVKFAFTSKTLNHWHPLTWLSHMTDCQIFGLDAGWHHRVNLFFHLANILLLYLVFRRMTGAIWKSAIVAALFALHPLHVESVAWVSSRKDVLSAFFWLLAMLAYLRYSEHPGFIRYLLVLVAFALGLVAKPMVVTLPVILLLMDYWPLNRIRIEYPAEEKNTETLKPPNQRVQTRNLLRLISEKFLPLFLTGVSIAITFMVRRHDLTLDLSRLWPTKEHLAGALISYTSYLVKTLRPLELATPYLYPEVESTWQTYGSGFLLLSVSALIFFGRKRYPYLLVGWLWYLITLLPVIGVVGIGPHTMADRYTYLPLIGLYMMITWGIFEFLKTRRTGSLIPSILSVGIIVGCLAITRSQVRYWKNSVTLFEHTLEVTRDNYMPHNNLGLALADRGRFLDAIDHYKKALEINPRFGKTYNNLGLALNELGRYDEAFRCFSRALKINPGSGDVHTNLGAVLIAQGKLDEAIENLSRALVINPNSVSALNNMGLALARKGSYQSAIFHFSEALRLDPEMAGAHFNLGNLMANLGKYEVAEDHFSRGLQIDPKRADAHFFMGNAIAKQGRLNEAVYYFSEALRIDPNHVESRTNLEYILEFMDRDSIP